MKRETSHSPKSGEVVLRLLYVRRRPAPSLSSHRVVGDVMSGSSVTLHSFIPILFEHGNRME